MPCARSRLQPGFAAGLHLAVGIGANTAIYSVVDACLLRTLPFADPARLMKVSLIVPPSTIRRAPRTADDMVWSFPKYEIFRQLQKVYRETAIYLTVNFNLTGIGEAERLRGEIVGAG
jgi:putative ABC transport system permease protein